MNKGLYRALRAVVLVCAPLFIVLSNLYVVVTPAFIRFEYTQRIPEPELYTQAERLALANATIHYLRSGEPAGYLGGLQVRGTPVYNEREISHLVDVKVVMRSAFWVHAITGVLLVLAFAAAWRLPVEQRGLTLAIAHGCLGFLVLVMALSLFAYTNFQTFFYLFHRLFFQGDTWLFSPYDTLIQLFPLQLWIDATFAIILLALGEILTVTILTFRTAQTREAQ